MSYHATMYVTFDTLCIAPFAVTADALFEKCEFKDTVENREVFNKILTRFVDAKIVVLNDNRYKVCEDGFNEEHHSVETGLTLCELFIDSNDIYSALDAMIKTALKLVDRKGDLELYQKLETCQLNIKHIQERQNLFGCLTKEIEMNRNKQRNIAYELVSMILDEDVVKQFRSLV